MSMLIKMEAGRGSKVMFYCTHKDSCRPPLHHCMDSDMDQSQNQDVMFSLKQKVRVLEEL